MLFTKEALKQHDILRSKQKIKDKNQTNINMKTIDNCNRRQRIIF